MNFNFVIDKNAAFFYCMQAVCGWDKNNQEVALYNDYRLQLGMSPEQSILLKDISSTLSESKDPRRVLGELYTGDIQSEEAHHIAKISIGLQDTFKSFWSSQKENLESFKSLVENYDLSSVYESAINIARLFNTDEFVNKTTTVYLLPSMGTRGSSGHVITGTDYMLLHPAGPSHKKRLESSLTTLLHEFVHLADFSTEVSRKLIKPVHESYVKTTRSSPVKGLSWRMFYSEAIAYCVANNITGGIVAINSTLRSYDSNKPNEHQVKLAAKESLSSSQILNSVGLAITPLVLSYFNETRPIDDSFAKALVKICDSAVDKLFNM